MIFDFDVTCKPQAMRMRMHEVVVYTVVDGTVAREEFFYAM